MKRYLKFIQVFEHITKRTRVSKFVQKSAALLVLFSIHFLMVDDDDNLI